MQQRKPESLALLIALIGTLTVLGGFIIDLVFARQHDLEEQENRLQHFSIMLAEHSARAFEAMDILLREMASDLARKNWQSWTPNQGWEYVAQRHSRALPQLRDLIVFDRDGEQRFISTYFPPPAVNIHDRTYFKALSEGQETATFGPFIGRNSNRYTYALARRIALPDDSFGGVALAAIDPVYIQEFCWSNRLSDDFEALMTNDKGQVVASCRPTDLSKHSLVIGALADDILFGGKLRGQLQETGTRHVDDYLISVSPVPGFADLRIISAQPESAALVDWQSRLFELSTLGGLVTLVLVVGGLLLRRQVRELSLLTEELNASQTELEARIQQATQALAGERDNAERANRAKSRFLAAASHDLRQPLHALSLFAADLLRQVRGGKPEGLPHLAEQIATSTAVLGELLDSLLDISRLDVGGITPDMRACQLAPMFRRLSEASRRNALERQLTLRFHPTAYWVEADPVMLERIVANLLSNALRYTPPGGRILVGARRRGGRILIEVRDSGIGIAAEHQAAIFAEFYQIGNIAREHNKGLGLGLSIVDRLARAMHIDVGLCSRLGEGTTFSLSLTEGSPEQESPPPNSAGELVCYGDSEEMANCIRLAEHWHYNVIRAISPERTAIPKHAVLLSDLALAPAIAEGLTDPARLIVIGASASAIEGAHHLPTPIRPAKLRALISQLQKTLSKSIP